MKLVKILYFAILPVLIMNVIAYAGDNAKAVYATLDNGMRLVLKENHSSPMITSVVFVNAGARYEDERTNGMTHFLEHLLFNGTTTRDRLHITETIEEFGGYLNAFTRKDLTAYLVLMPREYIDTGLAIQADQLFNSTLPAEEFPKERKIVIEEIRKDRDIPATLADDFFNAVVFAGSAYARTVIGTEQQISSITREEVWEYYKKFYLPNNMIALIIGDFNTEEMIEKYSRHFGQARKGNLPKIEPVDFTIPEGRNLEETIIPAPNYHLDLAFPAPHFNDPDYYPFYLLAEYLSSGETSPLTKYIIDRGLASEIYAALETQKDFSMLHLSAITDSEKNARAIIWELERLLSNPQLLTPSYETFRGLIVSKKTQEIYLREKLHYYGFMIAPLMVSTGYEFMETLVDSLEAVGQTRIAAVAGKYFTNLHYSGTLAKPAETVQEEILKAHFEDTLKVTLANGLEIIIKQNPDSRVLAINIFEKNRAAMEPPGKDGISDFVNRLLEKGTEKYSKEVLSEKLANIGAQLTLTDNPYIPYDDRYTSPQFAFVKFETIDEFAREGIDLLAEMLINPRFDSLEIENVRREMLAALGMASASTYQTARNSYYKLLFGEAHPLARVPLGTPRTIAAITSADLKAYHKQFYAPNNMIMTVCTNLELEAVLEKLKQTFGQLPAVGLDEISLAPPVMPTGIIRANTPLEKEQVYLYLGAPTIGINHPDFAALDVAAEILSSRLALQLREVQGLAYSIGAGVSTAPDFGWILITMGTGVDNYQVAHEGIIREITRMRAEAVSEAELRKAKNSIWGSSLTSQLSRINQAYYMAFYELMGRGFDYREKYLRTIQEVEIGDVLNAARMYFPAENYYLATVGLK